MKVTKRNGNVVLYDDEKIANSIVWANGRTSGEVITIKTAQRIADQVFLRLTNEKDLITTKEIQECVYDTLCEEGFPQIGRAHV